MRRLLGVKVQEEIIPVVDIAKSDEFRRYVPTDVWQFPDFDSSLGPTGGLARNFFLLGVRIGR